MTEGDGSTAAVAAAYSSRAHALAGMLGTHVDAADPADPDRAIIDAWAATVAGPILDVGSGTGRWSGHLAGLGHQVEGLEPAAEFVEIARHAHPQVAFHQGSIADLDCPGTESGRTAPSAAGRWSGILAWYSLIHLPPPDMPQALATLRRALSDDGSMLISFFTGPRTEAFAHPVAGAYRWPVQAMADVLTSAGFTVTEARTHPGGMHASLTATAQRSSSKRATRRTPAV